MAGDQHDKSKRIWDGFNNLIYPIQGELAFIKILDTGLADEYIQEVDKCRKEVDGLERTWKIEKENDKTETAVVIPYQKLVLNSLSAKIELARENHFKDSKKLFELNLQAEALNINDLDNVLEIYFAEVDNFFNIQKKVRGRNLHPVNSRDVTQYNKICRNIIFKLDESASGMFRRQIDTPANIDVKEERPDAFLGRINVGYEHFKPNLVRLISHEGSFGHNTHDLFSEGTGFKFYYSHATEGLAIFGEEIGMNLFYGKESEEKLVLSEMLRANRRMYDALYTAYDKLAFYDRLSVDEIVNRLKSRILSEGVLRQNIKGIEEKRDVAFSFGTVPYFVGGEKVKELYANVLLAIEGHKDKDALKGAIVQNFYKGHRPVSIIKAETDLILANAFKDQESNSGNQTVEKQLGKYII